MEVDGDSLFNAGFCLEKGMGIPQNYSQAAKFYHIAARKFGHFDAIGCYGIMLAQVDAIIIRIIIIDLAMNVQSLS